MIQKIITYSLIALLVLAIAPAALAQEDGNGEEEGSYFCENREDEHPVAAGIAEKYDVNYETVIAWFCGDEGFVKPDGDNLGFGEIMLALQTSALDDVNLSAEEILEMRAEGDGWGEIWQAFGLIGKPDHAGPPDWAGQGPPEWVGQGPPPWVGAPEGKGPPWWNGDAEENEPDGVENSEEAGQGFAPGRPPWAGPPQVVGRP